MGTAEAIAVEDRVGVGDEVAIGEEQELDIRDLGPFASRERRRKRRFPEGGIPGHPANIMFQIYVSHIDIFWFGCYCKSGPAGSVPAALVAASCDFGGTLPANAVRRKNTPPIRRSYREL
jgi:hypothetical protein